MIFCNEQLLQRVTSKFCNEQRVILQRVTSNEWISTSNEQRVKSYASSRYCQKFYRELLINQVCFRAHWKQSVWVIEVNLGLSNMSLYVNKTTFKEPTLKGLVFFSIAIFFKFGKNELSGRVLLKDCDHRYREIA